MTASSLRISCTLVAFAALTQAAWGGIVLAPEAPGAQQSTLPNVLTETFNSLPAGPLGTYVSPIGTYHFGAAIVTPDPYGGEMQTPYISVGVQSGTLDYDLTFNSPQTYFGFYWAAADSYNKITFYNGPTPVGSLDTATISAGLVPAYYGNPITGENLLEPYVYLNCFGTAGTTFTGVQFENLPYTGFETDNHSISVPEPVTMSLLAAGGVALVYRRRRRGAAA